MSQRTDAAHNPRRLLTRSEKAATALVGVLGELGRADVAALKAGERLATLLAAVEARLAQLRNHVESGRARYVSRAPAANRR